MYWVAMLTLTEPLQVKIVLSSESWFTDKSNRIRSSEF